MALNSFLFICLFPLLCAVYYGLPARWGNARNLFLLLVSYLIYMNWKPVFALVLLGITVLTFLLAPLLEAREGGDPAAGAGGERRRRRIFVVGGLLSLLPLLCFKYYNFLNDSLFALLHAAGLRWELPGLNWAIPVGISFYSFQAYAYLADVFHGRVKAERNPVVYGLFLSFFPQTMCGPISRAGELLPQLRARHAFSAENLSAGVKIWLWGVFLKAVVADRTGMYVDMLFANYEYQGGALCLAGCFLYSVQIYADFAGYSLMAVGVARALGFGLVNNFCRPYFAQGITDFWRRWHISLSRWLRDYVYIPLGGSRCAEGRTYFNILLTFLVSGLWHGASWTFVAWGAIHGLVQVGEKKWKLIRRECGRGRQAVQVLLTFAVVNLAWVFFRMPTFGDAFRFLERIFRWAAGASNLYPEKSSLVFMAAGIGLMLLKDVRDEFFPGRVPLLFHPRRSVRWAGCLFLLFTVLLIGVLDAGQFIYASF